MSYELRRRGCISFQDNSKGLIYRVPYERAVNRLEPKRAADANA